MIRRLYAIYDRVALSYGPPLTYVNDGEAIRDMHSIVSNPSSGLYHNYPSDYDVYYIGNYDNESGMLTPSVPPQLVVKGGTLLDFYSDSV